MLDPSFIEALLDRSSPEQVRLSVARLLPEGATATEKISAIEAALGSPLGQMLRGQLGRWIVEQVVPVEALVPAEYLNWRPPVRDAMLFVVSRLSDRRLAPKILEQIELPSNTPPETRLLRLIAKVPGLQKLGQIIARNRFLSPSLRRALTELENGIHDVTAGEVCAIVKRELGERLAAFDVRLEPALLTEASVSAVVSFTWRNPRNSKSSAKAAGKSERQRGVFKVLKPYIPECFAEDMDMLQGLAEFFGSKAHEYGIAKDILTDTFVKVRRLLQHEIHFLGEQKTLREAFEFYSSTRGIRVPRVIPPLCTANITAMSEERGLKVTDAVAAMPSRRRARLAERLIEALVVLPLFSPQPNALFHADPHAGNLFYDPERDELIILDWALTERLSREQRRHLALLVCMVGLRDPVGACEQVQALAQSPLARNSPAARTVREIVVAFLDGLPLKHMPGAVDAMRVLQQTAAQGIRFPSSLIMLSKVLFTLDGVIGDIRERGVSMTYTVACHAVRNWVTRGTKAGLPFTAKDLISVQCSAMFYGGRLSIRIEQAICDRLLSRTSGG
jgi:ubiquinone biosynthesis protein